MVKVHNAQKWTDRVELTKKTSHCKSQGCLRKRRIKIQPAHDFRIKYKGLPVR